MSRFMTKYYVYIAQKRILREVISFFVTPAGFKPATF